MDQLAEELFKLKRSYFSPRGKPGWSPLKESTLRKKKIKYPMNATSFNTATGHLRDSLSVFWDFTNSGVKLTVKFEDDAALIRYLTQTLGRDFFTFDNIEKDFIINRFVRLFKENVQAS